MAAIVFPLKEKNMLCISLYFLWLHETKIKRWDEPFFKVKTRWMLTLSSIKIWFDILPMWYYIIHFFGNQRWEERSSNYIPSSHTSFCILVFCEKKTFNLIFLWLCAVHAKKWADPSCHDFKSTFAHFVCKKNDDRPPFHDV